MSNSDQSVVSVHSDRRHSCLANWWQFANKTWSRRFMDCSSREVMHHAKRNSSLQLPEDEVYKVELMYSSRTSQAFVCPCLANLYEYGKAGNGSSEDWSLFTTGIPLLVVEETCAADSEVRLYIRVAELGTGFSLWKQPVSPFTRYCAVDSSFHTIFTSSAPGACRTVGISFDHAPSARQFYQQLRLLQANLTTNGKGKSGSTGAVASTRHIPRPFMANSQKPAAVSASSSHSLRRTQTGMLPSKSSISGPCCFKHITSLRPRDCLLTSYEALASDVLSRSEHSSVGGTWKRTLGRGATRSVTNLCEAKDVFL